MTPGSSSDPYTSPETVLVVDDDPGARQVLARLLEEGGFSTITAANGTEAMAQLEAGAIGVRAVLTDVSMPDMTGVELQYRVRDHYPDLACSTVRGDISDLERSVVARS